jgi:hypothetical protein
MATAPLTNATVVGTYTSGAWQTSLVNSATAVGQIPFSTNGTTFTPTAKIVSGTAQTAPFTAPNTSADFTGIPSWVKRITVMLNGVSTNGTSSIQVQIGSGSVITSGYTCYIANIDGTNATSATTATSGFIAKTSVAAVSLYNGTMTLNLLTGNTWLSTNSTSANSGVTSFSNGSLALGGALDRVRVTTVNGTDTFDAGSINILYE